MKRETTGWLKEFARVGFPEEREAAQDALDSDARQRAEIRRKDKALREIERLRAENATLAERQREACAVACDAAGWVSELSECAERRASETVLATPLVTAPALRVEPMATCKVCGGILGGHTVKNCVGAYSYAPGVPEKDLPCPVCGPCVTVEQARKLMLALVQRRFPYRFGKDIDAAAVDKFLSEEGVKP